MYLKISLSFKIYKKVGKDRKNFSYTFKCPTIPKLIGLQGLLPKNKFTLFPMLSH
jgi:hypothetical protein